MMWLTAACDAQEAFTVKTINVINILNKYHYRELIINDETLTEIKSIFLQSLDPSGLYFIERDIEKLLAIKLNPADFKKGKLADMVEI